MVELRKSIPRDKDRFERIFAPAEWIKTTYHNQRKIWQEAQEQDRTRAASRPREDHGDGSWRVWRSQSNGWRKRLLKRKVPAPC